MDWILNLNRLCSSLHSLYDVNAGGCCYLAYCIANNLEQLNIKYKFVVYDDYETYSAITLRKSVKNLDIDSCAHCAIEVNTHIINPWTAYYLPHVSAAYITADNIKAFYESGDWNDGFRRKYCKTINKRINKFFQEWNTEIRLT